MGGGEEYDKSGDEVNGYDFNGDVLQGRTATRNGAALTLAGYNWEVGRGVMSRWGAGWLSERADGCCDFPLVRLLCLQKMAI